LVGALIGHFNFCANSLGVTYLQAKIITFKTHSTKVMLLIFNIFQVFYVPIILNVFRSNTNINKFPN